MTFQGLEYLRAGTLSYKATLMVSAESFIFLSKECVPLEVDDGKNNLKWQLLFLIHLF